MNKKKKKTRKNKEEQETGASPGREKNAWTDGIQDREQTEAQRGVHTVGLGKVGSRTAKVEKWWREGRRKTRGQ